MNAQICTTSTDDRHAAPLFASPWLALFFVLRREFTQTRQS